MAEILRQRGEIYCLEGDNFTLNAGMLVPDNAAYNNIEVQDAGHTRCEKVDDVTIFVPRNPAVWNASVNVRLYDGFANYIEYLIYLTILPTLTKYNLNTTTINNTLGVGSNAVGVLSSSSLINPYSYYKPDKSAPHQMGEFDKYSHTAPGGIGMSGIITSSIAYNGSFTPYADVHKHWIPKYSFDNATVRLYDVDGGGSYQEQGITWGYDTYKTVTFQPVQWDYSRAGNTYTYRFVVAYNNGGTMVLDNVYQDNEVYYYDNPYYMFLTKAPVLDVYETTITTGVDIQNKTGSARSFDWRVSFNLAGIGTVYEYGNSGTIANNSSAYVELYHYEDYPISSNTEWWVEIYYGGWILQHHGYSLNASS